MMVWDEADGSEESFATERQDPGTLRRAISFETTTGPYFRLILDGLKESEMYEIRDLLRARGWLT